MKGIWAVYVIVSIFSLVLVGINQTAEAGHIPNPLPVVMAPDDVGPVEGNTKIPPGQAVAIGTASCVDPPLHVDSDHLDPILTNNAPALFPLGTTTVTWFCEDGITGNTVTDDQLVTVVDTTSPVVTAPTDRTVEGNTFGGHDGDQGDIGTATATDIVDPNPVITNDITTTLPLGTTTVTWTATDSSGNFATATQDVTVVDTTGPVFSNVPANLVIEGNVLGGVAWDDAAVTAFLGAPTASDLVEGGPKAVTNDGKTMGVYGVGVHNITFESSDSVPNTSQVMRTITVTDTTPPTITVNDIIFGACAIPVPVNLITFGATTSDIVDPNPTLTNDAPTEFPIGDTTVTWTSEDASGNVAVVQQKVTIAADDSDGDGITKCVDTQTAQFSNDFDDSPEGGQTDGEIETRGDQDLLIFDVVDPNGTLAFAGDTGGADPAKITVCKEIGELELDAGESAIATCTSVKIEILTGQVLVQFNTGGFPGTTTLGPTNILVYDDEALTITNLSATDAVILFNFVAVTISPGETVFIGSFAFPQKGGGPHPNPTIGLDVNNNQVVTCGVLFDLTCFTITSKFHYEFELYEMMSGTHTISITTYCAQGVDKCNYVAIGIMPYSKDMNDATWKIELHKDHLGNLTPVIYDPEGFLGEVTVTANVVDGKFWLVSFTIEFKNKDTGPMKFVVEVRDSNNGVQITELNEGVEINDAHAYPYVETAFEEQLKVEPLCIGEDVFHRHTCAFDKVKEWATNNAEETLSQMLNNEYIYK